jgi:hypothetical protein
MVVQIAVSCGKITFIFFCAIPSNKTSKEYRTEINEFFTVSYLSVS